MKQQLWDATVICWVRWTSALCLNLFGLVMSFLLFMNHIEEAKFLFEPCGTWTYMQNCHKCWVFDLCFMPSNLLGLLVPVLFFHELYWVVKISSYSSLVKLEFWDATVKCAEFFELVLYALKFISSSFMIHIEEANFLAIQALWNQNFEIHLSYLPSLWMCDLFPLNLFGPVVSFLLLHESF